MYIDNLADIANKYNNTYHSRIKMIHADVNSSTYIDFKENNKEDPRFKIGDDVRISKYKKIFAKFFLIEKFRNTVAWTYVIEDLNGEKLLERFMKKNCKKQIKIVPELKK